MEEVDHKYARRTLGNCETAAGKLPSHKYFHRVGHCHLTRPCKYKTESSPRPISVAKSLIEAGLFSTHDSKIEEEVAKSTLGSMYLGQYASCAS